MVATPGHTRGHVVFHDTGGGLLFAGDHVLPAITPSIGFEPVLSDDPARRDYLGSLSPDARAAGRAAAARARAGRREHPRRVDELIAHHGARLDERREAAILGGARPRTRSRPRLRWTRRGRALADLDPFNQMLAITETPRTCSCWPRTGC